MPSPESTTRPAALAATDAHTEMLEALRESEQRFRSMADNAPVLIWMADKGQHFTYVNKQWLAFTGRTVHSEAGRGWLDNIHPHDLSAYWRSFSDASAARVPFTAEYRLRRHDDQYRWILDTGIPRTTPQGAFLGYLGSAVDITERKELEQRKDEFVSIASHELKTPLTNIKIYAQLLERHLQQRGERQGADYVGRMQRQLGRLTSLIDDLLDISKIESGKLPFNLETFAIDALVHTAIDELQPAAPDHLLMQEGASNLLVTADPYRVSQVITNLLTNAIKYSPPDAPVIVAVHADGGEATVTVQDSGPGIPKEHQEKIFERFYRIQSRSRESYPGLGLGLYISREIITRHGGTIGVHSAPGKGATFYFALPLPSHA